MQTCPIEQSGARAWLIVLDTDDEVHVSLRDFDGQQRLRGTRFRAIGAFPQAVLGYFDWECKTYERIPVAEQVEAVSLTGDVALKDHHPDLHVHAVLGQRDGHTLGGPLPEGTVCRTLEVVLTESPAHLHRRFDPDAGLALIRLAQA